jgi:internalin A
MALWLGMACTPEDPADTDGDNTGSDVDPNDQINFPDPVLRACVEELTGKNPGDPIYGYDVTNITKVECNGVSDLTGMDYFEQIEFIQFYNSNIGSLKPIANHHNLKYLYLRGGSVKNLNEIANLKNLIDLEYLQSDLEDISVLASMENLEWVGFKETKLKSITALSSLPNITKILASDNLTLTTFGAQFTAPKLTEINVGNCGLTSLNELNGLPELKTIIAGGNYLTDVSFITTLPKLEGIGIDGNCLSESGMQTYVDWYNTLHPDSPTTVAAEIQYQDAGKCQ